MKTCHKKISVLYSILAISAFVSAFATPRAETQEKAYNPTDTLSREKLQEDFSVIRASFEEGHGALYRYSTKEEMDAIFDAAFEKIDSGMTEREFLRLLIPVVGSVNCGHTNVRRSNFITWLENQPVILPLGIRYLNRKPFLVRNYSERDDIIMGSELVSINGMPMDRIVSDLLPAISSDAHIETSKFYVLSSSVRFSHLFNIFYGITRKYEVRYKNAKTGEIQSVTLEGMKQKDILEIFKKRYPEQNKALPLLSFQEVEGVPVLTIRTFSSGALKREGFDYPEFLRETFQELADKKSPSLIIDLRDNGGGSDDFGKMLFAHLAEKDFRYYAALEIKNNTFDFFKYTNLPKDQWTFPESRVKKNERGWYDALGHPNLGIQKPIPPVYKGKVFVLINGRSFSATGETTSLMHYHKKAVFVGEECGAGYYGNTSGFMVVVNLPNSGISVTVPLVRYSMAVDGYPEDRGIIPEFPFEPTVEDVLVNRDSVLLYAVNLTNKIM
jgi:C-terminal processing protease CtpA/Prc